MKRVAISETEASLILSNWIAPTYTLTDPFLPMSEILGRRGYNFLGGDGPRLTRYTEPEALFSNACLRKPRRGRR